MNRFKFVGAIAFVVFSLSFSTVFAEDATSSSSIRRERMEKVETRREAQQQKMEEQKLRLQGIRDEQKQKITERVLANISSMNERWANHLSNVLTRLTAILDKIETRADAASAAGTDTTELEGLIATARESIKEAQAVVDAQAEKTYEIEVTDEQNLGQQVRSLLANFKNDIKAVHAQVKEARKAVVDALNSLKGVSGEHRNNDSNAGDEQ